MGVLATPWGKHECDAQAILTGLIIIAHDRDADAPARRAAVRSTISHRAQKGHLLRVRVLELIHQDVRVYLPHLLEDAAVIQELQRYALQLAHVQ
eukprot:scaffold121119_cov28-Tisochrysis_lutea.AAC.2